MDSTIECRPVQQWTQTSVYYLLNKFKNSLFEYFISESKKPFKGDYSIRTKKKVTQDGRLRESISDESDLMPEWKFDQSCCGKEDIGCMKACILKHFYWLSCKASRIPSHSPTKSFWTPTTLKPLLQNESTRASLRYIIWFYLKTFPIGSEDTNLTCLILRFNKTERHHWLIEEKHYFLKLQTSNGNDFCLTYRYTLTENRTIQNNGLHR